VCGACYTALPRLRNFLILLFAGSWNQAKWAMQMVVANLLVALLVVLVVKVHFQCLLY